MMRGQRSMAVAVRGPNGQVRVTTRPVSNAQTGIRKIWFVRGVVVLVESLVLGASALFESANASLGEEEEKISGPLLWGTLLASFVFAAAIFFVVPLLITDRLIDPHLGGSTLVSNLLEGIVRVADLHPLPGGGEPDPRHPNRIRLPRRGAQDHQCLRTPCPSGAGTRVQVLHGPCALRHQLPLRGDDHRHNRVRTGAQFEPVGAHRIPHRTDPGHSGRGL